MARRIIRPGAAPAAPVALPRRGRRLRRTADPGLARDRLAARAEASRRRRHAGQLRGPRLRATRSPSSSCTASAASGRTGSRTSRGWRRTGACVAIDLPGFGLTPEPERRREIRSRATAAASTRSATARPRPGRARRQLDGRVRRRRGGDPVPRARGAARARLGRRDLERETAPGADPHLRPGRHGARHQHRARHRSWRRGRSRGTCRSPCGPPPAPAEGRTSPTRASSRAPASPASTTPCAPRSTTTSATGCPT